jgi:pyruvate dehydrogenase E2 component (dihydrolipoamide acetyltransferase)
MESGTIVKWLKAEGDAVEKGEPLYELDTEKVTQEVEAEASGVLVKIVVADGEVAVGTTIAFIGEAGEQVADGKVEPAEPSAEEAAPTAEPAQPQLPPAAAVAAPAEAAPAERQEGDRIKASPLARRLAREQGIDLAALSGTGPDGRIVAEDVERASTATPAAAPPAEPEPERAAAAEPEREPVPAAPIPDDVEHVALTSIRRTIAKRLTAAWQVPVYQLVLAADMDAVNHFVERRRALDPDERVTVTDVLVKVCAAALMRHTAVNVQFTDDELLVFPYANIGIAVATDRGLVVPVVHGAEHLTLAEVAAARADIVTRAREGGLRQEDLDGGTFTISNLGMFGLDQFTAVLNPPQAAILAVGASQERPVVWEGQIVARPTMTMTLTCDHRAVDGAPAAEFLETVKAMLEDLSLAL